MVPKYNKSNIVKVLMAVLSLVIIFSIYIIRENLRSVESVSTKTESLINVHITGLQKIADLEKFVSDSVINLHRYYANIDKKFYDLNVEQIKLIRTFISDNSVLFENDVKLKLLDNLLEFEQHGNNFDQEMSKSDRDWDLLRQHLYDSQKSSNEITKLLNATREDIRENVEKNSTLTLDEITTLNSLQIIFVIGLSLVLAYLVFVLYGRVKDQEKLYQLAYFDPNTNLPNKSNFEKTTSELIEFNNSENQIIFLVTIDQYKLITGRFGYLVGERLVQEISNWLTDILIGDENNFRLYKFRTTSWLIHASKNLDADSISNFANKLLNIQNSRIIMDDIELTCSFSIGIAVDNNYDKEKVDLIREADAALNISLQDGGNCFNIYTEHMGEKIKEYVDIDSALRRAIDKDELSLYFQPKVHAVSGELSGSEVLLRWNSNGKMIGPNIFIPIAERSGLIVRIGNWVLEKACEQWSSWQQQGLEPSPIAVNISALQFRDPKFPEIVKSILLKTKMPAYMLELEITEEVAAINPEEIIKILNMLKHIGVTIALDDFGTGYSSLSYLKRFPIDVLKIDQSFVRDMNASDNAKDIVKLIVDLSKKLNYRIVAEGVETDEQYQQLKEWDCDYMQGYLFSKPVEAKEFSKALKQDSIKTATA